LFLFFCQAKKQKKLESSKISAVMSFFVNITGQICKLPCASVQTRQRGISFVPQEKISGLPFERVDIGARPADFLAMQRKNRQKVWK